jgi:hypothetical protein
MLDNILSKYLDHANVYFLLIVNGKWSSWESWISCTKTCVGGTRTRHRSCNNPTPDKTLAWSITAKTINGAKLLKVFLVKAQCLYLQ